MNYIDTLRNKIDVARFDADPGVAILENAMKMLKAADLGMHLILFTTHLDPIIIEYDHVAKRFVFELQSGNFKSNMLRDISSLDNFRSFIQKSNKIRRETRTKNPVKMDYIRSTLYSQIARIDLRHDGRGSMELYVAHAYGLDNRAKKIAGAKIVSAAKHAFSSPHHPFTKARLLKQFNELQSDLSKRSRRWNSPIPNAKRSKF